MNIENLYKVFKEHPEVTTDSRNITNGSVYFALRGEYFNGNDFAKAAIENGCSYAVVDDNSVTGEKIINVPDSLVALQELAKYHRKQCGAKVFAITGTNGKTTTKELIASVLSNSKKIIFTQGNLNNHIGVPLTLLKISDETEIAVIEMGANHPGEINFLCEIADPDAGLITNVGVAHIEGFGSFQGVVNTKTELYRYLHDRKRPALINAANQHLMSHSDIATDLYYAAGKNAIVTGHLSGNDVFVSVLWNDFAGNENKINTQISGSYNLENILAAIAVGKYYGISDELINKSIADYKPANKRSQYFHSGKNEIVIDTYNANPTSMKAAIENVYRINKKNKALILGDMFELGGDSEAEHKNILQLITTYGFKTAFLAGNNFNRFASEFPFNFFETTEALVNYINVNPIEDSFILLKGSRGMKMETVLDSL